MFLYIAPYVLILFYVFFHIQYFDDQANIFILNENHVKCSF